MILAGDIGGTNSRLAAFEPRAGGLALAWESTVPSARYPSFLAVLEEARAAAPRADAASFGIAGPVRDGVCVATNLPWRVDAGEIARSLGLPRAGLINDLEATAWGVDALGPGDTVSLQEGRPGTAGNQVLLAAGTGLGTAGRYDDGRRRHPFACEGGHATFAPEDGLQVDLWRRLHDLHGHVSWERVLSGRGLEHLYDFLKDREGQEDPPGIAAARERGSWAPAVTEAAAAGSGVADRAVDLFAALLGSAAGNLALTHFARGGVFLAGGIAPRIVPWLRRRSFAESFVSKGRLRPLLEEIPVSLIVDPRVALRGAALHAATSHPDAARRA